VSLPSQPPLTLTAALIGLAFAADGHEVVVASPAVMRSCEDLARDVGLDVASANGHVRWLSIAGLWCRRGWCRRMTSV